MATRKASTAKRRAPKTLVLAQTVSALRREAAMAQRAFERAALLYGAQGRAAGATAAKAKASKGTKRAPGKRGKWTTPEIIPASWLE